MADHATRPDQLRRFALLGALGVRRQPVTDQPGKTGGGALLAPWDFDGGPAFSEYVVDYGPVINFKQRLLRLSYENYKNNTSAAQKAALAIFKEKQQSWLEDYALFAVLKDQHGGASWNTWELAIARRQPAALEHWREDLP